MATSYHWLWFPIIIEWKGNNEFLRYIIASRLTYQKFAELNYSGSLLSPSWGLELTDNNRKILLKARAGEHSKQKPASVPDFLLARIWQQAKRPRHIPCFSFAGKYRDTPMRKHRLKLWVELAKKNLISLTVMAGFRDVVNVQYHYYYRSLFYTVGDYSGIISLGICSSNQSTFHKYFYALVHTFRILWETFRYASVHNFLADSTSGRNRVPFWDWRARRKNCCTESQ